MGCPRVLTFLHVAPMPKKSKIGQKIQTLDIRNTCEEYRLLPIHNIRFLFNVAS